LGATDFHPFGGGGPFPSGHTAAAFTIAASIAQNNGKRWVKGLACGVAGMVAYSRMESDAHWLSDVTASAFIGIGIAKQVVELDHGRRALVFAPLRDQGTWGLQITRTF
jgi:membrane-associated phospholipid phosphatase